MYLEPTQHPRRLSARARSTITGHALPYRTGQEPPATDDELAGILQALRRGASSPPRITGSVTF